MDLYISYLCSGAGWRFSGLSPPIIIGTVVQNMELVYFGPVSKIEFSDLHPPAIYTVYPQK